MRSKRCPWCRGSDAEPVDVDQLCRGHLAEHEGLSEAELDRMEAEQYAEWRDAVYG